MNTAFNTLTELAAQHSLRFLENATPATTRQIGFLAAIIRNNNIALEDIIADVEHYNGGHAWGLDKECASALISAYATPADLANARNRKAA